MKWCYRLPVWKGDMPHRSIVSCTWVTILLLTGNLHSTSVGNVGKDVEEPSWVGCLVERERTAGIHETADKQISKLCCFNSNGFIWELGEGSKWTRRRIKPRERGTKSEKHWRTKKVLFVNLANTLSFPEQFLGNSPFSLALLIDPLCLGITEGEWPKENGQRGLFVLPCFWRESGRFWLAPMWLADRMCLLLLQGIVCRVQRN